MATSGNFSTSNKYIVYWFEVIQNSQNINNNTSNVTVKVWIKRTNTGYETSGSGTLYTNIDGVQRNIAITSSDKITSTPRALFHQTLTINHNSDGSKVLNLQASISHSQFSSSGTGVYNYTLTAIPRASTFTVNNTTLDAGATVTGNITRANSSFTHKVYLGFGTKQWTLASGVTTSFSATIPMETLNEIPNATKGQGNIRVVTYNGSTEVGQSAVTFYINAPTSVVPSFSSLAIERVDNTVPTSWGVYVQGKSKAKLTINGATGSYGSTISKYNISGDSYSTTSSSFTTGVLNSSGTVTFTGTITDSRGRTVKKTTNCSVVAYSAPAITAFTATRCNSSGTANDEGSYVKVKPVYTYSTVSGKNTLTAKVEYKLNTASSWTNGATLTASGTEVIVGGGNISPNSSYDIRLVIQDAFETVTKTIAIPTASTTLDFRQGGNGIAIGKVSEKNGLEVEWESYFNKNIYFNTDPNGYARTGYDASTGDVFISNTNNNFFRIKPDKTMTIAGKKVYTELEKPTSAEIGALPTSGAVHNGAITINEKSKQLIMGCGTGDVFLKNSKSGRYLQFYDDGTLRIDGVVIGSVDYAVTTSRSGQWFNRVPVIANDGVVELGKYIDFHATSGATNDYDIRLTCSGSTLNCSGSFTQGSDIKLKENIHYLDDKETKHFSTDIDEIEVESDTKFRDFFKDTFRPCTFNYKNAKENLVGFIAQDIADTEVGSLFVREMKTDIIEKKSDDDEDRIVGEESYLTFDLSGYTTVVAKALQEEIAIRDKEIENLQNRIGQLEELIKGVLVNK